MGATDLDRIQSLAGAAGILTIAIHNQRTPIGLSGMTPGQDMLRRVYRRILEQLPR